MTRALTRRFPVAALLALALVTAGHSAADAGGGKGRLQIKGKLERVPGANGQAVIEHTTTAKQRVRRWRTLGLTRKTMMESSHTRGAGGTNNTLTEGRESVNKVTTKISGGTRTESTYRKKGFIMRWKNRKVMSRTDDVRRDSVKATARQHRFNLFGSEDGTAKNETVTDYGRMDDGRSTRTELEGDGATAKMDRSGNLKRRGFRSARNGRAFDGKLKGRRTIEAEAGQGMAVVENQTRRWGLRQAIVKRIFSLLTLGKTKKMEVEQAQTEDSSKETMTTPTEELTISELIGDGVTESTSSYKSQGFLARRAVIGPLLGLVGLDRSKIERQKGNVKIGATVGVARTETLRTGVLDKILGGRGLVKKVKTEKAWTYGADRTRTSKRDRSGNDKVTYIKASSPRMDQSGKSNWVRSRTGRWSHIEIGRVDGKLSMRLELPLLPIIGKTVITANATSGEITAAQE